MRRATIASVPAALLLAAAAAPLAAQSAAQPAAAARITSVPVRATVQVAGTTHTSAVDGKCFHYPDRQHAGQPAEVWSFVYTDVPLGGGAIDLSIGVTKPRGGADVPVKGTVTCERTMPARRR